MGLDRHRNVLTWQPAGYRPERSKLPADGGAHGPVALHRHVLTEDRNYRQKSDEKNVNIVLNKVYTSIKHNYVSPLSL